MKRVVLWLSRVGIAISLLVTAIGGAYAIDPSLFDYFLDFIGLTTDEIVNVSLGTGLIGFFGLTSKMLKASVNTDLLSLQVENDKRFNALVNELQFERENHAKEIIAINENWDNLYQEQKVELENLKTVNKLILQSQVITAQRVINYDFTSEEDTKQAQEFINAVKEL